MFCLLEMATNSRKLTLASQLQTDFFCRSLSERKCMAADCVFLIAMRNRRNSLTNLGSVSARITTAASTSHSDAPRGSIGAMLRRPRSPASSIYVCTCTG
jgi:hypothetical protein